MGIQFDQEMQPAPEVQSANKGVGGSELGTGYEADGEGSMNPAVAPKVTSIHQQCRNTTMLLCIILDNHSLS